jgi:hypothetical protein
LLLAVGLVAVGLVLMQILLAAVLEVYLQDIQASLLALHTL